MSWILEYFVVYLLCVYIYMFGWLCRAAYCSVVVWVRAVCARLGGNVLSGSVRDVCARLGGTCGVRQARWKSCGCCRSTDVLADERINN